MDFKLLIPPDLAGEGWRRCLRAPLTGGRMLHMRSPEHMDWPWQLLFIISGTLLGLSDDRYGGW